MRKLSMFCMIILMTLSTAYCSCCLAGWSLMENPYTGTTTNFYGVWGSSETDVYFAGTILDCVPNIGCSKEGIILHYDGIAWQQTVVQNEQGLTNVGGTAADNVYVVGAGTISTMMAQAGLPFQFREFLILTDVWGVSANDMYITGTAYHGGGIVYHCDGSFLSQIHYEEISHYNSIWGTSSTDIFVAGSWDYCTAYDCAYYAIARHYDGTLWANMSMGRILFDIGLSDIWGIAADDAYMVGSAGTVLHYDGTSLSLLDLGITADLNGVWGSAADDVFAVGGNGTILHYYDSEWNVMNSGTTSELRGVWGSSADNVFAVGNDGTILRYDGVLEENDNCDDDYNPGQADLDGDNVGDVCDNCPEEYNVNQEDTDIDGIGDACDTCINVYNPFQIDCDNDGAGDICDADTIDPDADGVDVACDNCPESSNPSQADYDEDGTGDVCDECTDTDMDGYGNPEFPANTCPDDNCLDISNPLQEESYPPQGNGIGNACECEGNFNCCRGSGLLTAAMRHYSRRILEEVQLSIPALPEIPCNGDFNCDGDVDGTDASLFKSDFGRSSIQNPCPVCVAGGEWCAY